MLSKHPVARDFVADAYAHCKFVAYTAEALPLFEKAGVASDMDEGFFLLSAATDPAGFIKACRELRLWNREAKLMK
jgi:catalase